MQFRIDIQRKKSKCFPIVSEWNEGKNSKARKLYWMLNGGKFLL